MRTVGLILGEGHLVGWMLAASNHEPPTRCFAGLWYRIIGAKP